MIKFKHRINGLVTIDKSMVLAELLMYKKLKNNIKNTVFGRYLQRKFFGRVLKPTVKEINHEIFNKIKKCKKDGARKKLPLRVLFLVLHKSVWKVDSVFLKMLKDPSFEPLILIAPYLTHGEKNMESDMNDAYHYFKSKNYPVMQSYDFQKKIWLDVGESIKPDLIFMTNPHNLTKSEYYDKLFKNYVCYYVPYDYQISNSGSNYRTQYNQPFHNTVYKIFSPHHVAKKIHQQYSNNKGRNVGVTGYPAMEVFMDKAHKIKDLWKKQADKKMRIIWAPHHTIDAPHLPYANFLKYFNFFQELVEIHRDAVQWAFKPHPLLKIKLINHEEWGEEKTNRYWEFWRDHPSCQLEDGEYTDLFLTSDAMIHDSGSFLVEYLYIDKPVLYLMSSEDIKNYFNPFGCDAFDVCYHGINRDDITTFIKLLLQGGDPMKPVRDKFVEENLYPYFKQSMPSDRIISSIKKDFRIK